MAKFQIDLARHIDDQGSLVVYSSNERTVCITLFGDADSGVSLTIPEARLLARAIEDLVAFFSEGG